MSDLPKLNAPWLVAVWPGMGQIALAGGYYLMSKLKMTQLVEFRALDLFDMEYIEVQQGIVHNGALPRSRLFVWRDPNHKRDIIVFIGEAQPPMGKWAFCHRLLELAEKLGVEQVITFAAMGTPMQPTDPCRVFSVATDAAGVESLRQLEVHILENGQISGLNGVLLAASAEHGIRATGLLGEMPGYAAQLPFPKASAAVLDVFATLAGVKLDLAELQEHGRLMEQQLTDLLEQVQQTLESAEPDESQPAPGEEAPLDLPPPLRLSKLSEEQEERIESLFRQAADDRDKAYELKSELDRLGAFKKYENRFLDLFKAKDS